MITLHIFFDKGGFFSNITIDFIEAIQPKTHYYYFENNLTKKDNINNVNSHNHLFQLIEDKIVNKVVFHSLHTFQFPLFSKIKSFNIKIAWVFWSFEYYQLPFNLSKLYSKENSLFKFRKYASLMFENMSLFLKGKIPSPLFINSKKYYSIINQVDEFYSFIEDDFFTIYSKSNTTQYSFLSYLNIDDLSNNITSEFKEKVIMVGHSGSPLLNHFEVLNEIKKIGNTSKILIPVTNGNKKYIEKLKRKVSKETTLNFQFLDKRLPLDEYYSLLSSVSVFFINSYCQLGLGNIVFFLLNGTTIYFSEKSSTFTFLQRKGFHVFSIESLKSSSQIQKLTIEESLNNQNKIKELISVENVKKQWIKLLSE